ncbi:molybdenum cofactor guanylyltransferase [Halobacillus seohaensis]|uniref:Probable molybdenum cofactor guanylyltransferase n=1 Tax=Halobacillus seohaensis TaxID=447421 RepID=A0ABW2EDJ9_9BACI
MITMEVSIGGAILAGGGSTRMGTDKANLYVGTETVLTRTYNVLKEEVASVLINRNEAGVGFINDIYKNSGPLAGLHAVLDYASNDYVAVAACDTPFIDSKVIQRLLAHTTEGTDAIIPVYDGRIQPLSGIYHKRLAEDCERLLSEGERKMQSLLSQCRVTYVTDFSGIPSNTVYWHFFNMNTKEDYEEALKYCRKS